MTESNVNESNTSTRRRVRIMLTKDKLKAMVSLCEPQSHEPEITAEEILEALSIAGVSFGIDNEAIENCLSQEDYGNPFMVAQGIPAKKGDDAKIEYMFDTIHEIKPTEDKDGRIDYRNMNFIRNVKKDTVLVKKTPPQIGVNGTGVDGCEIIAPRGRDYFIKAGENTHLSEDKCVLTAETDGAIVFRSSTVSVKEMATISGSVDYKVGNIDCVGSVRISGDVCPGFSVKAGGNIEIQGNIDNAAIEAEGDVIIKGGCRGSDRATPIRAGGDVIIKYAEGQKIYAGRDAIVGGELINCRVIAKERVRVKGRKGKIIGGEIHAGKQIIASIMGSDAGTATVISVAFDEKLMNEYSRITKEIKRLKADSERVRESMTELYRLQLSGKLSSSKREILEKLEDFQNTLPAELEANELERKNIEARLEELRDASVIAREKIFPGVKIQFGIVYRTIEEEIIKRKMILSDRQVVTTELTREDLQAI